MNERNKISRGDGGNTCINNMHHFAVLRRAEHDDDCECSA